MPSTISASLGVFLQQQLDDIDQRHLRRTCHVLEPTTGPTVRYDGKTLLHFASNDYLGLARDPRVVHAAQDALSRFGLGSGASRLMSGTCALHHELEERLARFKGAEAALVFSSGYLANVGTITALAGPDDVVCCDHANHASLIDACRLSRATLRVFPHGDVEALARMLDAGRPARRRLIVTDGVFSMDGDLAELAALVVLAEQYDAWLFVDDAHGCFVLGERGRGSLELCDMEARVSLRMGTLSKALGSLGGYVAGSRALIDYLVNRARSFIYSTALPPAVIAGALAALNIVEGEPQRRAQVLRLAARLREGLQAQGWDTLHSATQIVPVVIGDTAATLAAARALLDAGIFAPAIRPPTVPRGTGRIRLSVTALHTDAHIDRCLEAFATLRARP